MTERSAPRAATWGFWLLGLLLLQGCAASLAIGPPEGCRSHTDSTQLCGRRFKPGGSKASVQPSKPSDKSPAAKEPREPSGAAGSSKPGPSVPRVAAPSYKLGESDGGPGQWEKTPVRPKGAGYQKEITGAPEGVEYAVPARTPSGKVLFDGYKDGKLLDAKDWEQWPPADAEFWQRGVLDDAEKQLGAARGTPIEWCFPNEEKAQAVRKLLDGEGIGGIDVKVIRKK